MNAKYIKNFINLSVQTRASIVYLFTSIVQRGLTFILNPIFTRLMPSNEFGKVSVYNSYSNMIGVIAMFCLSAGAFDIGMVEYKNDRNSLSFSFLTLSNIITMFTGFVTLFLYPCIGSYIGLSISLLVAMFIEFLFKPAFTFWTRRERFEYHYKMPAIITVLGSILSSVFSVVCVLNYKSNRVEARIYGTLIPFLIIYIFFWFYLGYKAKYKINFSYWKFAFCFNLPLIPHYLASYVLSGSDRLMINSMIGSSQAAYYSLACSVSAIMLVLWEAINSSLVPFILEGYEKKEYRRVSEKVSVVLILFSLICVLVIFVAPEVIKIMGTDEYYEAIYVMPPVITAVFFQALYNLFTNILYYRKKPSYVMYASIFSAILNIALNYKCIKLFGYIAAGYTTVFCFVLQATIDYFISKRVMGFSIYSSKFLVVLSSLLLLIMIISNFFYAFTFVRYIIVFIVFVLIMTKRDAIFKLL